MHNKHICISHYHKLFSSTEPGPIFLWHFAFHNYSEYKKSDSFFCVTCSCVVPYLHYPIALLDYLPSCYCVLVTTTVNTCISPRSHSNSLISHNKILKPLCLLLSILGLKRTVMPNLYADKPRLFEEFRGPG